MPLTTRFFLGVVLSTQCLFDFEFQFKKLRLNFTKVPARKIDE